MYRARALWRTRGETIWQLRGKAFDHCPDISLVETGWTTQDARLPYPLQFTCERLIKFDWNKEVNVNCRQRSER
jgi:hypothetical protein